jgi:beta-ureidopropionase
VTSVSTLCDRLYGHKTVIVWLPVSHYDPAMARIVRAALLQTDWPGTKEAMLDKHEQAAHDAKAEGADVICFQELFYGPYFCQVQDPQYYDYTEAIPEGSTTQRFAALAKELGMVIVLPMYEVTTPGTYYNTAAVIDADGTYLGKFRKQHIPQTHGFWEKYYFKPGNGGYPVFDTAVGKVGVYICYDRHFPEGWRALGLNGAEIVFNPSATSRGLSEYIWRLEQPAAAVANMYFVGAINRVGVEELGDDDFYGQSYFVDPEGKFVGDVADAFKPELIVRDLDLDMIKHVRDRWAFYRDRRPDAYDELVVR